jgi:hypothetical protein
VSRFPSCISTTATYYNKLNAEADIRNPVAFYKAGIRDLPLFLSNKC